MAQQNSGILQCTVCYVQEWKQLPDKPYQMLSAPGQISVTSVNMVDFGKLSIDRSATGAAWRIRTVTVCMPLDRGPISVREQTPRTMTGKVEPAVVVAEPEYAYCMGEGDWHLAPSTKTSISAECLPGLNGPMLVATANLRSVWSRRLWNCSEATEASPVPLCPVDRSTGTYL